MTTHLLLLQADRRELAIPVLLTQCEYDKIRRAARKWGMEPSKLIESYIKDGLEGELEG